MSNNINNLIEEICRKDNRYNADAYAYELVDNIFVPESATMALLGLGGMLLRRRRRA